MNFQLRLLQSVSEIRQLILEQIRDFLQPRLSRASSNITQEIQVLVAEALRQEPEYQSLASGQLKAELGLPDTTMVDAIVLALSQSIEVTNNPIVIKQSGLGGGFTLRMIKSDDLGGVISNANAIIDSAGGSVQWLEWLTLRGNEILVRDYKVQFGPNRNSRSGMAIMRPSLNSNWRVPPQFAGTEKNNWITRAIERIENNVYDLIIKSVEAEI